MNHEEKSPYSFIRKNCSYTDTLSRDGKGAQVKSGIGLIWSGFRPSDDSCRYGYLIPSNMFAVVVLNYLKGSLALAHNGNLVNAMELREQMENTGAIFHTSIDSEIIAYGICAGTRSFQNGRRSDSAHG